LCPPHLCSCPCLCQCTYIGYPEVKSVSN
jgi:hypothetical protein